MLSPMVLNSAALDFSMLGTEVPLPKIDHALQELWASDEAKTRASLINFAIYSEDPTALAKNNEMLKKITEDHSCRALLITCVPQMHPERARAWINALCRPYQGRQVVCSEQISFILEGGSAAQLQNIVFAHLDSDLPLIIWWQGPLVRNFDERLYSRLHTLIIDSSSWQEPSTELLCLAKAHQVSRFDVRDLSWTRSHFMRTALAAAFQDVKAREQLTSLETIEITHAPGQRCSALLLGGWICQRLNAELMEGEPGFVFAREDGSRITLELQEIASEVALSSLRLHSPCLELSVTRQGSSAFVHTHSSCAGVSRDEMLPADFVTDSELISAQLSRAGGNTHFRAALPLLSRLLAK